MEKFPSWLTPEFKKIFTIQRYQLLIEQLRRELTDMILQGDENTYFSLDVFARKMHVSSTDLGLLVSHISDELKNLGWSVKTSFGGTGLFVYSSETPPSSCYSDEF